MRIVLIGVLFLFMQVAIHGPALAAHGVTVNGSLKYPPDFQHFDYTSEKAVIGGELVLHAVGSFDKMNPFTLKGTAPYGLDTFVFDRLGVASLDEPTAEYGLIARDIAIAEDRLSVTYTIDERARFADGSPVTAADIAYSVEYLKGDEVHPFYPYYYRDIASTEVLDDYRVTLHFGQANRELPLIATQLPVLSKKSFQALNANTDAKDFLEPPVGSGPYLVDKVVQGKFISYRRNPLYWAKDHPTRKGMYNFERITVKYYKDSLVALEAFKAGEFDVLSVNIAKQWARDLNGPRYQSGELVKKVFSHSNNAGMQGFLMNTRRDIFADRRVRQAIGLAFDFAWTNSALFFNQYTRADSFFSNSHLAARGVPQGLELEYLEQFRDVVPQEVFDTPLSPPVAEGKDGQRKNLRRAQALLRDAGYTVKDGVLVARDGTPFQFEITLANGSFERVMAGFVDNLSKLGMKVSYRTIDPTIYTERLNRFDFDMIVMTYGQSQSPGNEQRNFWHSEAADQPGSNNYAGIRSPAVDGLIDRIIYAATEEQLVAACRALDRVLWYGYYLVPNWYVNGHRITYRDIFGQPEIIPEFYSPMDLIMTWWRK